ncbi:hypothetical protein Clacol_007356 [Clathrus columnatus]|uniref:3-hydroxyisobutyryl-CoA hydrolase n=1 Tax=Clathrus columnatus TaxID=1419009 RepID=A0AAV5AJJ1_9AGAM|nr:hypothetical protein Clacol_007356 [Clathrus columnatus]
MSRYVLTSQSALERTSMLARHMSSSLSPQSIDESLVQFESNLASRTFMLNRDSKRNALSHSMIKALKSKLLEWNSADLCEIIIGTGKGSAFCSGGDIAGKFELNHLVANLNKPYVAVIDGLTMGGGAGLSIHAPFRVATEKTLFAMPETKIGYCPDVGSNYFLSRLDGEIGTYLAMTGTVIKGRAVFELGLGTHFISSSRLPDLKAHLAALPEGLSLDKVNNHINTTIEELYVERNADEPPSLLVGKVRSAVDTAFSQRTVETIMDTLSELSETQDEVGRWAKVTLEELQLRSPTSLRVSLEAVRRGKGMSLEEVLNMELGIATAYINGASPDFITGVTAVLVDKFKGRPAWVPEYVSAVMDDHIEKTYFDSNSPFWIGKGELDFVVDSQQPYPNFGLPFEEEIKLRVTGAHTDSGGMSLDLEELIQQCESSRPGKHGVREKVLEIVQRRCKIVPESSNTQSHLEWVY